MQKGMLPIQVSNVGGIQPCESCGVNIGKYRAQFNPPGRARVTHKLCKNCVEAIRND